MGNKPAPDGIYRHILLTRGHRVMLDSDLAELYGISTGRLNEQVRRNIKRFPTDFMFILTRQEFKRLISHFAISNIGRGGRRTPPMVFTQEGIAMLSGILHSDRAIEVNIAIMRAFIKLREILFQNKELAERLEELEHKFQGHDEQIQDIFAAIRELMAPPKEPPKKIGFLP